MKKIENRQYYDKMFEMEGLTHFEKRRTFFSIRGVYNYATVIFQFSPISSSDNKRQKRQIRLSDSTRIVSYTRTSSRSIPLVIKIK